MKKVACMILSCVLFLVACSSPKSSAPITDNGGNLTTNPSNETAPNPVNDTLPETSTFESEEPPVSWQVHDTPPLITSDADVIEIKEKLFIAQTNDIYINPEDYLGKTIKYEGIFDIFKWEETGETYYYVIRYGPGCCGLHDNAGFEVSWDGNWPQQNDWVEAVGVLEIYEEDGWEILRLSLTALTILDVRGAERVFQ